MECADRVTRHTFVNRSPSSLVLLYMMRLLAEGRLFVVNCRPVQQHLLGYSRRCQQPASYIS